jgi:hypothetical protein
VGEPNHKTRAAPKLDVASLDKALDLVDGLGIACANQRLKSTDVPVVPDGVSSIFQHPKSLDGWEKITGIKNKYSPIPDSNSK